MRWLVATLLVALVAVALWLGSALIAVGKLTAAVRAGDGASVLARTDLPALRQSLTEQIVRAYLKRTSETRRVSQIERMVANTYGATVTDAVVANFLTADRLTSILKSGRFNGADNAPAFEGMPSVADLKTSNLLVMLNRIGFIQPVRISIRISQTKDADRVAAIQMHLDGAGWRLAGIDMPKATIRQIAASLSVK